MNIPNKLSELRLLLAPVLWVLFLTRERVAHGILLLVAGLTDVLDGYLARHWQTASRLGSRIDTLADLVLLVSMAAWLLLYDSATVRQHGPAVMLLAALVAAFLAVEWIKFRRVADLHLYSAKAAGLLAYAYMVLLLVFGRPNAWLFRAALAASTIAALESLLLVVTRRRIDEHAGTLFARRDGKRTEA